MNLIHSGKRISDIYVMWSFENSRLYEPRICVGQKIDLLESNKKNKEKRKKVNMNFCLQKGSKLDLQVL